MRTVFIIHGAYGNPTENWIPWLKQELGGLHCRVIVPHFPTPHNQSLRSWLKVMQKYEKELQEDSIIIGHSLGPAFILAVFEMIHKPVKAAFLIAPFISPLGITRFDSINKTFYREFKWKAIKKNCKEFYVFHADNDPYVPLQKAEEVARKLGVKVTIIKNAGHFNAEAGYTTFGSLLREIKRIISPKRAKKAKNKKEKKN